MNNAPFYVGQKVVCVIDGPPPGWGYDGSCPVLVKGTVYEVEACEYSQLNRPFNNEYAWFISLREFPEDLYHQIAFAPIQPLYSDITAELASKVEVGDTADSPIKVLN